MMNELSWLDKLSDISNRLEKLERSSQGGRATYLGDGRLLVRCDWNQLRTVYIVDANDLLITPNLAADGYYEPSVTDFFARNVRTNDHCLDVGANFGYYTCIMAKLAYGGKVIGIEADPIIFEILKNNVLINWCESVCTALNVAVADSAREVTLYRRPRRSGNTSLTCPDPNFLETIGETPAVPFSIASLPIDSFLDRMSGRVDFVKVDIEGAEPLAFRGVRETIRLNPNVKFVVEWSPGQMSSAGFDARDFTNSIAALGLKPFVIDYGEVRGLSFEDLIGTTYLSGVVFATGK